MILDPRLKGTARAVQLHVEVAGGDADRGRDGARIFARDVHSAQNVGVRRAKVAEEARRASASTRVAPRFVRDLGGEVVQPGEAVERVLALSVAIWPA